MTKPRENGRGRIELADLISELRRELGELSWKLAVKEVEPQVAFTVRKDAEAGYRVEPGPSPGWETVPTR